MNEGIGSKRLMWRSSGVGVVLSLVACNGLLGIESARLDCDPADCPDPAPLLPLPMSPDAAPPTTLVDAGSNGSDGSDGAPAEGGAPRVDAGAPSAGSNSAIMDMVESQCAREPAREPFCIGPHRVTCGAAGGGVVVNVCASSRHCAEGVGSQCGACSEAAFVCRGAELWGCDPNLAATVLLERCASAALCDPSAGSCHQPACAPGEVRCQGAQLQRCNDALTGLETSEICASAELCDAEDGACQAPRCEPNERRCSEERLEVCNPERTGFVTEESCVSAALCDPGSAGCIAPACASGQRRCRGAQLETCNATRSGFVVEQTCESAAHCDAGEGVCVAPACAAGEQRCQGARLEVCNAARTGFVLQAECAGAERCDAAAGACAPAFACDVGEHRCRGTALEACNTARDGFERVASCGDANLCDAAAGRCDECVPGARRCIDSTTVGVCDDSGSETASACSLLESCRGGECRLLGLL